MWAVMQSVQLNIFRFHLNLFEVRLCHVTEWAGRFTIEQDLLLSNLFLNERLELLISIGARESLPLAVNKGTRNAHHLRSESAIFSYQ